MSKHQSDNLNGPSSPDFIDNQDGNTMARALVSILGFVPNEVRIATSFFNPTGFSHIADHLQQVGSVRLLLGNNPPAIPESKRTYFEGSQGSIDLESREIAAGLDRLKKMLLDEWNRTPFTKNNVSAVRKLVGLLKTGNIKVKLYKKKFLHAKTYIFTQQDNVGIQDGIIVGSSNLTSAGLTSNLELNLGFNDPVIVKQTEDWFEDLWNNAEDYDLAELFEEALQLRTPWEIFIRVLLQLYGKEFQEEEEYEEKLDAFSLTNFQKHGVARALRLIDKNGGVIVADEVGLGKTFIAGEILQHYRKKRQKALLICPAALRDSTWKQFSADYEIYIECLSYEQLANDEQINVNGHSNGGTKHLNHALRDYQLIIVDEAHNYRNPIAPKRAKVLRGLMYGDKRDLLLLTATPVNNSLWDLYHLIRYFIRQDAHLANQGILSIRERFVRAMQEEPANLSPDLLYPIIEATTVKRTRQFVKKHYGNESIKRPGDVKPLKIVFPNPKAISVRYKLDNLMPGFFDQIEQALDPDNVNSIKFARYQTAEYLLPNNHETSNEEWLEEKVRSQAATGLLRTNLLKRFESSTKAFYASVDKMAREHQTFLNALEKGFVVSTAFLKELSADDENIIEDLLDDTSFSKVSADKFDKQRLHLDVKNDLEKLIKLRSLANKITTKNDPKLKALAKELCKIVEQAENDANNDKELATNNRKVIVFSFFEDTIQWIKNYLENELCNQHQLEIYKNRMVVVSGSEKNRQKAVNGFAPVSMGAITSSKVGIYDLMIASDVLAEGVNLQQCRHIINYDMPWNPMRLVQRHGRIDRVASRHKKIFLRTFFPEDRLEQLLNLEKRIHQKLAMAAASIGVAAPIEGSRQSENIFADKKKEIDQLFEGDSTLYELGGMKSATQTGEDYRLSLRNSIKKIGEGEISSLPWKSGSGMVKGTRRGVFFCAVVAADTKYEKTILRFVDANDSWEPITNESSIESEVGVCLRLIECSENTPIWHPEPLGERVFDYWKIAQQHIYDEWMHLTDPVNLHPAVRPINHKVADFIRKNQPPEVSNSDFDTALDIVESPWPRREEVMLQKWFKHKAANNRALAKYLIGKILDSGLEAADLPKPLPAIGSDDIELLCWMGIERQS